MDTIMRYAIILVGLFAILSFSAIAADDTLDAGMKVALPKQYADTSGWTTFVLERKVFDVKYPVNFQVAITPSGGLRITHSIPFEHHDQCDMSADTTAKELTDFDVSLTVVPRDLRAAYKTGELGLGSLPSDSALDAHPEWFVAPLAGSYSGLRAYSGVEGCGQFRYYYSLSDEYTLFVTRELIIELSNNLVNYEQNRQLPGVVLPEQEEAIFQRILSTFRYLE